VMLCVRHVLGGLLLCEETVDMVHCVSEVPKNVMPMLYNLVMQVHVPIAQVLEQDTFQVHIHSMHMIVMRVEISNSLVKCWGRTRQ
jgi:hypothetical protein